MDDRIAALLEPVLAPYALELEEVDVRPAGKRRVVRIVVDGEGPDGRGPLLDDIAEATRAISTALDEGDTMGAAPYTLEVSSRGVSRPLTLPRHWRRNRGRLVAVTLASGERLTGRIVGSDDDDVTLDVDGVQRTLDYPAITTALVQVELNRPRTPEEPADVDDDDSDDDTDDDTDDDSDDEPDPQHADDRTL